MFGSREGICRGTGWAEERIQNESNENTPCSFFIGKVGAALETNDIIAPECFNIVNELSRSPPQPKPEGLDDKCLADLREVCQKTRKQYLGGGGGPGGEEYPGLRQRQNY